MKQNLINSIIEAMKINFASKEPDYFFAVLENPKCPVEILEFFAEKEYSHGHSEIAKNPNATASILRKIVTDNHLLEVNEEIASNPKCPKDVLIKLYDTNYHHEVSSVLRNPSCPDEIKKLASQRGDLFIRRAVVRNPKASVALLKESAQKDGVTDTFILANPNCTIELMEKILVNK